MSVTFRNTTGARRVIPGYEPIEPGGEITLSAEEAKRFGGGGLVDVRTLDKKAGAVIERVVEKIVEKTVEKVTLIDLGAFPDEMSLTEAKSAAEACGVSDKDLQALLAAGKIEGARREGGAANSPWKIPKAALIEALQAELNKAQ